MPDDAVVGFDAAARPGAPHGYIPELDHLVVVDKVAACRFFLGRPDLAPDLREDQHLYISILQGYHLPGLIDGLIGIAIKAMIRIKPPQQRQGAGIGEWIGRKNLLVYLDRSRRLLRSQAECAAECPQAE